MLAAAIDTGEGFFMEQAHKTVAGRHLLHDLHCELVLVCGKVACGVDGCKLVLCRSDFVVLGLGEDAQFPQFFVQLFHICGHPGLDCAEIVVVHFLTFGRLCTKKSAAGIYKVLALFVHFSVNEKILLLRANRGDNPLYTVVAEKSEYAQCLLVERFHAAQKRSLLIQRFAAVGTECSGDAKGFTLDKSEACGIPGGIASGLKGGAQAAGGKRRCIRLTFDKLFAGKVHDHAAVRSRCNEAVMLFGCDACQRLKPVGEVSGAVFDSPVLHGRCHGVCKTGVKLFALLDGLL